MLVIDDNMLKLSKMQEALLERSSNDRQANLKKYESTVKEIDKNAFSSLLGELDQVNEHNQTLEEELQFLEQIKAYYEQLYEMQLNFKRVCEKYGDNQLELSDLSQINIDYIENRISDISGYLINLKNIESNKKRLQELNEKLIEEEKTKEYLGKRLQEYEDALRENFISAEGRCVVDGQLQYISIISEYQKLTYDFKELLTNPSELSEKLAIISKEKLDTEEKLKAAELCYNSIPSTDSKQILDEITKEFLSVRYRLTMLKIVDLLSQDYDEYDLFIKKRENLLDLIKYRMSCLSKLGVKISIDPFSRTKIPEQLSMVSSLSDNSKSINKIKKEIASLSQRLEEMISQNDNYMISLNDRKELLIDKSFGIGLNDIDVTAVTWDVDDYFNDNPVLDNQVVSVKVIPMNFKLERAQQKTNSVVKRCNEMVNGNLLKEEKKDKVIAPELVIVPQTVTEEETKDAVNNDLFSDLSLSFSPITDFSIGKVDIEEELETKPEEAVEEEKEVIETFDSDLFETVDPFVEAPLFTDRSDEFTVKELSNPTDDIMPSIEPKEVAIDKEPELTLNFDNIDNSNDNTNDSLDEELPDAFWVTQDEEVKEESAEGELTFDEQIDALLADDNNVKVRKLAA